MRSSSVDELARSLTRLTFEVVLGSPHKNASELM